MRVVSGTAGGLRLVAPEGAETRPTSDRVREATFNALGSLGVITGARVLDLFAGSGAMGIEALSRGAAHATFVERDRAALRAISENLRRTGFDAQATVIAGDAYSFAAAAAAAPEADSDSYDIAICDPPYAFDRWDELLSVLPARVAVLESDHELAPAPGWEVGRTKRYGGTVVIVAHRLDRTDSPSSRRDDAGPPNRPETK